MGFIEEHIMDLISTIITEIETRNVDVLDLCDKLSLTPDEFVNLVKNPIRNVSLYIEILEGVRNERD